MMDRFNKYKSLDGIQRFWWKNISIDQPECSIKGVGSIQDNQEEGH